MISWVVVYILMMSWIVALAAAAAAAAAVAVVAVVDGWMGERRTRSGRMFVVRGQDLSGGYVGTHKGIRGAASPSSCYHR